MGMGEVSFSALLGSTKFDFSFTVVPKPGATSIPVSLPSVALPIAERVDSLEKIFREGSRMDLLRQVAMRGFQELAYRENQGVKDLQPLIQSWLERLNTLALAPKKEVVKTLIKINEETASHRSPVSQAEPVYFPPPKYLASCVKWNLAMDFGKQASEDAATHQRVDVRQFLDTWSKEEHLRDVFQDCACVLPQSESEKLTGQRTQIANFADPRQEKALKELAKDDEAIDAIQYRPPTHHDSEFTYSSRKNVAACLTQHPLLENPGLIKYLIIQTAAKDVAYQAKTGAEIVTEVDRLFQKAQLSEEGTILERLNLISALEDCACAPQ